MKLLKEINKMANKNCCICHAPVEKEDAPVIAMSAYGNPKCVCSKCEALIDAATSSHDPDEINEACKAIGEALTRGNTGDEQVIATVNDIITSANERCIAIKDGTYDFALDEKADEDEFEITEELMETEEDKEKDQHDEKVSKIIDTVGTWVAGLLFVAAAIFFIIKIIL